jgi:hypothetical protein
MTLLDAAASITAHAWRVLVALVAVLWPPLRVNVRELEYEDVSGRPGDLPVVSSNPRRYRVALRILNRATRTVFVESIRLQIETETAISAASPVTRLAPDELTDTDVTFPLQEGRSPWKSGTFVLSVVPTRGRAANFRGRFPIPRRD